MDPRTRSPPLDLVLESFFVGPANDEVKNNIATLLAVDFGGGTRAVRGACGVVIIISTLEGVWYDEK